MRARKNTVEVFDGSHFSLNGSTLTIGPGIFGVGVERDFSRLTVAFQVTGLVLKKIAFRSMFVAALYVMSFLVFQQHQASIIALWAKIFAA